MEEYKVLKQRTPRQEYFRKDEKPFVPVIKIKGKNKKQKLLHLKKVTKDIRKENKEHLDESKRQTAWTMYNKILIRAPKSEFGKRRLREEIRSLRPSIEVIKASYIARGESSEMVDKIVNYKNYPNLPAVKITKKQFKALMDAVNNIENPLHTTEFH